MLYSHSHQEKAFDFFASFLRNAIEGDPRYKALVEPVILDTQLLAKKEKDYFNINRNSFDVIVFLAQKDPQFFKDVNVYGLSPADYKRILELVTTREIILA